MNAGVIFRYRIPNCTKEILHGLAKRFLDKIEISKRFVFVFCGHKTNSFKKPNTQLSFTGSPMFMDPHPRPTACISPACSMTTATASNQG